MRRIRLDKLAKIVRKKDNTVKGIRVIGVFCIMYICIKKLCGSHEIKTNYVIILRLFLIFTCTDFESHIA